MKAEIMTTSSLPDETREALKLMIGQIPLALAIKNGGEFRIKASEIDATGNYIAAMAVDGDEIVFYATPAPAHLTGQPS